MQSAVTKKYQLPVKKFIKLGLLNILREQWWVGLIALGIAGLALIWPNEWIWFVSFAVGGLMLYVGFWWAQFYAVSQMEQAKPFFQRMYYEINNKQLLMKVSAKEGMPLQWEQFKKAERNKEGYLLFLSKGQFVFLPYDIFKNTNGERFTEAILKRKNLLKGSES